MPWTAPKASSTARGYGTAHQRERKRWQPIVDAGYAQCQQPTCIEPTRWIEPGTPWALGHTDDRSDYLGPVHTTCNQRDGAIRGQQASAAAQHHRRQDTPRHSRNWHNRG